MNQTSPAPSASDSSERMCHNQIEIVGRVASQLWSGSRQIVVSREDAVAGQERRLLLHLPAAFGNSYGLPIWLDANLSGQSILDTLGAGALVRLSGTLDREHLDGAAGASRFGDVRVRVTQIVGEEAAEPGSCARLEGTVFGAPRIAPHPLRRNLLLAHVQLQLDRERRFGARQRFIEHLRLPLVVPTTHPDAPALLRPGNRIIVEGMLERLVLEQRGEAALAALAALDARHRKELAPIRSEERRRSMEQRQRRSRRSVSHEARTRIIVGYAELLQGSAASVAEGKALRRQQNKTHASNAQAAVTRST